MPSSQSIEVTHNAIFTTMVTGVGSDSFTYQWRHSEIIISGETNSYLIIPNLFPNNTGLYSCTVMNQYGDSDSSSASLIVTGICNGRHHNGSSYITQPVIYKLYLASLIIISFLRF